MYTDDRFAYTSVAPATADVTIDESTQGKEQLLRQLADCLAFPDYFGGNWDALIDCLSDLSWLHAPETVIDHAGLPNLGPNDLRLYLECLIDASARRTPEMIPQLRILFRVKDRSTVAAALAQ
jgi:hypothetical protein